MEGGVVSKMCVCGGIPDEGRSFCRACIEARKARGLAARNCSVCGALKPGERRTCATCSPECQVIAKRRNDEILRDRHEKHCEECGNRMLVPPSLMSKRFCSRECSVANTAKNKPKRSCLSCGAEFSGKRQFCSEECYGKWLLQRSTIGCRSEQVRAKRRKHSKNEYKRKDKAQVVAALTEKQHGKCAVCGGVGTKRGDGTFGLVLDHDHKTGAPRAMLCGKCNAALGLIGESPAKILALHKYALQWAQGEISHGSIS